MKSRNHSRQRIVSFATEKFLQEGFTRITVGEIASELSMSKKTFYAFFTNKQDLLDHVMVGFVNGVRTKLQRIVDSDKNFIGKLADVMTVLAREVSRIRRPMQVDLQKHAPDLWRRLEKFRRQRVTEYFSQLVEQGKKEGFVRTDVDQRIFLLAYLGAIERIVQPQVLIEESFSSRQAVEGIMAVFFHGILTPEASRKLRDLQQHQLLQLS